MITIGLREEQRNGGHTTVRVFVGRQVGSRGRAGTIILRNDEWDELADILRHGEDRRAQGMGAFLLTDVVEVIE